MASLDIPMGDAMRIIGLTNPKLVFSWRMDEPEKLTLVYARDESQVVAPAEVEQTAGESTKAAVSDASFAPFAGILILYMKPYGKTISRMETEWVTHSPIEKAKKHGSSILFTVPKWNHQLSSLKWKSQMSKLVRGDGTDYFLTGGYNAILCSIKN